MRVPQGWRAVTLRELIGSLNAGVSVNSEGRQKTDGEIGVLKTSAISNGIFVASEHKAVVPHEVGRVKMPVLADRIIISRMNTPALVGASAYTDRDYQDLFLPDRLWLIDVKDRRTTHVRWLSYVLSSDSMRKKISGVAAGTSGSMKNISKDRLLDLQIIMPPYHEQRLISDILCSVDDAIAATQTLIEQTFTIKQSILKRLLTKGIGHTRFKQTEVGVIPVEWNVRSIGSLLKMTSGKIKSVKGLSRKELETLYPVYGGNGVAGYDSDYLIDDDVIIMGRVGENCGVVHRASGRIWVTDNALYTVWVSNDMNKDFLATALAALPSDKIRGGGGQPLISQKPLYKQMLCVPPLQEQEVIAAVNAAFEDQHLRLVEERECRAKLKSTLMSDLLTGRKRVTADALSSAL